MAIRYAVKIHKALNPKYFSIYITPKDSGIYIRMDMQLPHINTTTIPATFRILSQDLPGIYKHRCFNPSHLPFAKEVLRTEVGHLFEHILLEYLCELNNKYTDIKTTFRGETSWDWGKDKRGTFHIYINTQEEELFKEALERTINLMNKVLTTANEDSINDFLPSSNTIL